MANKKISQLTAKGTALAATDLVEISESDGAGGYVTKSVTGANVVSGLQPTLVSATKIKTINGTTILGSGNLVAGGGGVHILIKPVSGRTYNAKTTSTYGATGTSLPLNTIRLNPFIPANSLTVSNLQININTAFVGALARILIYSDSNGVPDSKLLESTSIDVSTTGVKTYTASFTFTAGTTYWLGCYSNITLPNISQYQSVEGIPISTNTFESPFGSVSAAATFPTAPSPLGTATPSTFTGIIINLTAA
jgi:hypothetical protein